MVPDDVFFEGGAGKTVRSNLLGDCDVQTLLRLVTSVFYAHGVKSDVLFFQRGAGGEEAATRELWICYLRTSQHFTLKANPLERHHTILNSRMTNRVYRNPTSSSPVVFKTIAFFRIFNSFKPTHEP